MIRSLFLLLALFSLPANAAPTVAEQVYEIGLTLRDPASANLSLSESETQIAYELKGRIAQMVVEGRSVDEIEQVLVERYGEQIRYQPGFNGATAALWLAPLVLLVLLIAALWRRQYRTPRN